MSIYSEGSCEVVQIADVEKHPNADKLEIATFYMKSDNEAGYTLAGYRCVIGKGQFKPNDLAVYVGVDSLVPLEGEESDRWQFLKTRLDGAGKFRYRVKAARLRGVYSEGILMEPPMGARIGDELWETWKIGYYSPQVSSAVNQGAVPVTSKKRKLNFPEYQIASLRKVPELIPEGTEVVVTEKIHGTNARFGWIKVPVGIPFLGRFVSRYQFVVGSHRAIKTDLRTLWERAKQRLFGVATKKLAGTGSPSGTKPDGGFYGHDLWNETASKYDLAKKLWDYRGYVFYGEIFGLTTNGKPIQDLGYGSPTLGLRMFDVFDCRDRSFVDYDTANAWFADCELDSVPVVYRGPFSLEETKLLAEGHSLLAPKQIREGVVVKALKEPDEPAMQHRLVAKMVGEGYRLRKQETIDDSV